MIAFDLDGTLVDSATDLATAASRLVMERGGRPLARDEVVAMVGEGAAVLVAFGASGFRVPPDAAATVSDPTALGLHVEQVLRLARQTA